jgi:hypothetical protein
VPLTEGQEGRRFTPQPRIPEAEATMRGSFTKAYRKEPNSNIREMSPLYQRTFYYLRQVATWKQRVFPTKKKYGISLNPGQIITSLSNVACGVSWHECGAKKVPCWKTFRTFNMV